MFDRLRQGDVLLHHPFESFDPVETLLREAVHDPQVLSIQQTIYRTSADSVLMDLLLEAIAPRQRGDGGGRAEGALRRRGQHQLGRAPRGVWRAGGVRHRRPEDARQDAADHAPRGPPAAPLRAPVHRQLQPAHRAPVHRRRASDRQPAHHRRHGAGVPAPGEPEPHERPEVADRRALHAAQAHDGTRQGAPLPRRAPASRRASC